MTPKASALLRPSPQIYRWYLPPKPRFRQPRTEPQPLPRRSPARRAFRRVLWYLARAARRALTVTQVQGLEHLPEKGPALLVTNHLGDADVVLLLSVLPWCPEVLASRHLQDVWWIRWLFNTYGVIWVYRGTADLPALKAALQALREGRILGLAPEGRQTLIQGLEPGTLGAAYLALKSGAPVIPIAITGTENWAVFPRLKRGQRLYFTLRVGEPFYPRPRSTNRRRALEEATEQIMLALARLLPPSYRGVYADAVGL